MNIEATPTTHTESLDAKWYPRFEQIGSFQAYEYLDGDKQHREEQREKFMAGDSENPSLDYPKIDPARLERDEVSLVQLKRDIIAQEPDETIKQVYRWRLNEKIAELRMLKAVSVGDMKRFKKYSEFVYGKPSQEIFTYTIEKLKESIASSLDDPTVQEAARELDDLLPADFPKTNVSKLPDEIEISLAREQTLMEMSELIDIDVATNSIDREYATDEIRDIFQAALDSLAAEGWSVAVESSSKSGISVDQEHKTVKIPESRKLVFDKIRTLIAHEIGTHVARRLNGERSKLQLLGLGLDRYEKGEEGVATMREQVLGEKIDDFAGLEGHLAISLAVGLDGNPRDFKQVYTIMERLFYFKALSSGNSPDEALKSAKTSAWNRTVRTFRGTDCSTKGACFTKDIVYREGNIGVWEMIKNNPSELTRLSVGKYDPANNRHIWILDQLGITDSDLEQLEQN